MTTRFNSVGECIYCGVTQGLSDEHIIPLALGGTVVLPAASCTQCAAITSAIERKVLRGFMYKARVVSNFPSRRKNERPRTLQTKLLNQKGVVLTESLPVNESAALLPLPILTRASFICGDPPTRGVKITGIETIHFGKNVEAVIRDQNATSMEVTEDIQAAAFVQLLAKIAYGYHVATQGLFPRNETPLLRLIRGNADDGSSWVGSDSYTLQIESKNTMHALGGYFIRNAEGKQCDVIRVKLFASIGVTGYEIVTRVHDWERYAEIQA